RPSTVEQVKVRARRRGWAGRVAQRRRKIGHVHRRCDAAASAGIDPEKYLHNLATAYAYMSKRQPNLLAEHVPYLRRGGPKPGPPHYISIGAPVVSAVGAIAIMPVSCGKPADHLPTTSARACIWKGLCSTSSIPQSRHS